MLPLTCSHGGKSLLFVFLKVNRYKILSKKNVFWIIFCSILVELGLGILIFNRRLRVMGSSCLNGTILRRCKLWSGGLVGWLFIVPATCYCVSGKDLLRQFYVLPHWDRSCRSNFLPHPVTVYWHRADRSQCWPCDSLNDLNLHSRSHLYEIGETFELTFLQFVNWFGWNLVFYHDPLVCFFFFYVPVHISGVHHFWWYFCMWPYFCFCCCCCCFLSSHRGNHIQGVVFMDGACWVCFCCLHSPV